MRAVGSHGAIIGAELSQKGQVASVEWLRDHLSDPTLRVADVRWSLTGPPGRERYDAGHLPGAVFLDADRELSSPGEGPGRHPVPAAAKLSAILGERGIGDDHVVVAYDDAGGSIAARLWWLYRHYGHDGRCAVLDGGIQAWSVAGLPLTVETPSHPRATWTPGPARDDLVATESVEAAGAEELLIDARAGERYRGETEPIDSRAGHIPGAVSIPWSTNLDAEGRFLPPEALRTRYADAGAVERRPVIAYCGSSLSATHDLLAMELAGIRGGRLYEGSWSHWSSDPERPAATGPRP